MLIHITLIYLPNNTKKTLNKLINEIDEFKKLDPLYIDYDEYYERMLSPEEEKRLEAEYHAEQQFFENNPNLKFKIEYDQKCYNVINILMENVLKNLEKDPGEYDS